jgi:hypothetical protein
VNYLRWGHTANIIGSGIYLFGGKNNDGYKCDLKCYDIVKETLTNVNAKGDMYSVLPYSRKYHGSAVSDQKLYIFGGLRVVHGISGMYNDLCDDSIHEFNPTLR